MKLYQKIITGGLVVAGLAGIFGCDKKDTSAENVPRPYHVVIPSNTPYNDARSGVGVTLGDVDGDGSLDLVVGSPQWVKYFKGNGEGRFTEQQTIVIPSNTPYNDARSGVGVTLGDVDGDGSLDLVVGSPQWVRVYRNNKGVFEELQR
ncbi:MAG: VCBS repeat-containing protein [Nanoarchaeota archaeon]|nr:VCBS repeat-containing protein [Nanoarchaeota archaeon]